MNRNEELIKKLKEIADVSFRLYDLEKLDKYLRLSKGAERLAELAKERISADEAASILLREGVTVSVETINHFGQ